MLFMGSLACVSFLGVTSCLLLYAYHHDFGVVFTIPIVITLLPLVSITLAFEAGLREAEAKRKSIEPNVDSLETLAENAGRQLCSGCMSGWEVNKYGVHVDESGMGMEECRAVSNAEVILRTIKVVTQREAV